MPNLGMMPITIGPMSTAGTGQPVTPKGWSMAAAASVLFRENAQTYAASMTPELTLGNWITIVVTNNVAFTLQNPTFNSAALAATNVPAGMLVAVSILNASGGATGAITLGTVYKGAAGFGAPANNQYVSTVFLVRSATQFLALSNWSTSSAF